MHQNNWGEQLREFRLRSGYHSQEKWIEAASTLIATLSVQEFTALQNTFGAEKDEITFSQGLLSRWETNNRKPPKQRARHLYLIWVLAHQEGIQQPEEADSWLEMAGLSPLTSAECQQIWPHIDESTRDSASDLHLQTSPPATETIDTNRIEDWGEAPSVEIFYGREAEQARLTEWLRDDGCRMIGVWGIGGQGKTTLAFQLCRQVTQEFDAVIWRSLLNTPPIAQLLAGWIQQLSQKQIFELPRDLNEQFLLLFDLLREKRCLLILDNAESILEPEDKLGRYIKGYEEYGQLFLRFGETQHESCLLLTSREEPHEFTRLRSVPTQTEKRSVRSLALGGLDSDAGEALLTTDSLRCTPSAIQELLRRYSGNPLALILVSNTIVELYGGDIDLFLSQERGIFNDVQELLAQHINRLTPLERSILYWLAIEREPITVQALHENLAHPAEQAQLGLSLRSLRRRSLIEIQEDPHNRLPRFTLQNVILENLTDCIIQDACHDFLRGELLDQNSDSRNNPENLPAMVPPQNILHQHALLKATSKSYIRQSQERMILQPIAENLLASAGRTVLREKMTQRLEQLRQQGVSTGYEAGNILNLLLYMQEDLSGINLSHLPVWQAAIQNRELQQVNLSHADLTKALLYERSGRVLCLAFHPNGKTLFAGTTENEIGAYRVDNLQLVNKWSGSIIQHIKYLNIGADARSLVSSGADGLVHFWDLAAEEEEQISDANDQYIKHHAQLDTADRIRSVAVCANGSIIATGSANDIRLWEIQTQQHVGMLEGHHGAINFLAYSRSNGILASGDGDQQICLWQIEDPLSSRHGEENSTSLKTNMEIFSAPAKQTTPLKYEPLATFTHPDSISDMAFSPDGTLLAVACHRGEIYLWNVQEICERESSLSANDLQPQLVCMGHVSKVHSISFNLDGTLLASGGGDRTIRIWQTSSGQTLHLLQGHQAEVEAVQFSPDGTLLASGSNDRTLRLWETASGQELHALGSYADGSMSAIDFSPDGQRLISGSDDGIVRIWDLSTRQCQSILREQTNYIFSVAYSPDGESFASASLDQTICLWASDTGALRHRLTAHRGEVTSVAYHPALPMLASGSDDQTMRLWDTRTGKLLHTWPSNDSSIWSVAFSPNGESVAMSCSSGAIYIWDVESRQLINELRHHQDVVWTIAFSPDGKYLASAGFGGEICLWDMEEEALVQVEMSHTDWVRSLAFSPDSQQLVSTAINHEICLWELETGKNLYRRQDGESAVFHPDGQIFATSTAKWSIHLWNTATGERVGELEAEKPFHGTNIMNIKGISPAQRETLKLMGAIEEPSAQDSDFGG